LRNENIELSPPLLVARSIVNPEMDNIPLRIINVNSEPCTLYIGTIGETCKKIREEDIQSERFIITCVMKILNYLRLD
jgi:hypothetical protein